MTPGTDRNTQADPPHHGRTNGRRLDGVPDALRPEPDPSRRGGAGGAGATGERAAAQRPAAPGGTRWIVAGIVMALGVAGMFVALAHDLFVGGGWKGIGVVQLSVALGGFGVFLYGIHLTTAAGQQMLRSWRQALMAERVQAVAKFVGIALQLGLLVMLVRAFHVESPAFYQRLMPLAAVGFVMHHLLPTRYRLLFFVFLSLAAITLVFGPVNGGWLVAAGLGLIALCHLPVAFALRVGLLLAAGAGLGVLRAGLGGHRAPWSGAVWPILASMFMFRLIAYMYDLRRRPAAERMDWTQTLAYFFLLPNVAFPLFPVVDVATFRRSYYDQDAYAIYQRGVHWMLRGVSHLLVYRLVYQYATISAAEVTTLDGLVRYLLATFGLYLRVSGQFHLVVGMLHLFGFRLPETHRFFYLASSFTDFWRRINIYWKEFMQRVVYMPAYFPLRKRAGDTTALVLATLAVFVATWLAHSYQWFWILGAWPFSATDALFWGILAVVAVANSLYEVRHPPARTLGARSWTGRALAGLALRTAGTFAVVCLLWSLWNAPTVADWTGLFGVRVTATGVALALGALAAVGAAAVLVAVRQGGGTASAALLVSERSARVTPLRSAALSVGYLAVLCALSASAVTSRASLNAREVIRDLHVAELSGRDAAELRRGYYETLVGVNRFNSQLWEVFSLRRSDWPFLELTAAARPVRDFQRIEIQPLVAIMFHGAPLRTNQWGMRDRDYERLPPANGYRVAILGASHVLGEGVGDDQTFENVLEDRLNRGALINQGPTGQPRLRHRYEILNFGVSSFTPPQQIAVLERALTFRPNAVYLVAHQDDDLHIVQQLARLVHAGVDLRYEYLHEVKRTAGLEPGMTQDELMRRLRPYAASITAWSYREIVARARAAGITPVWIGLSTPEPRESTLPVDAKQLAADAGFTIVDLAHVYDGQPPAALRVAPWDRHPNARGHALIAAALYDTLTARGLIPR